MQASIEDERRMRLKFWNIAREAFPGTGEPGVVWVLAEVLEWPWGKITNTPVEGFSRQGYRQFRLDADGEKMRSDDGMKVKTVYREWTKAEKSKLKDWWWILGY